MDSTYGDITLLPSQQEAFNKFKSFCNDPDSKVFILTGYAGTGKTTLLKIFAEWFHEENSSKQNGTSERESISKVFIPLASTGRAAKILSDKIRQTASTVHACIYSFTGFNRDIEKVEEGKLVIDDQEQLLLQFNLNVIEINDDNPAKTQRFYLVDEASMISDISDGNPKQAFFGTGKLLTDLFNHDPNGKYVFIGDPCQLPPIRSDYSPALDPTYIMEKFHYPVQTAELKEIVRQGQNNDLIIAASEIRECCDTPPYVPKWYRFHLHGFEHIKLLNDKSQMLNDYAASIKKDGYNSSTLITRTNHKCVELTDILRPMLGFSDGRLMPDELLLVTQNNKNGLMNGDLVRVKSIGSRQIRAHLTFLNIEVEEISHKRIYRTLLIEDILYSSSTNLNQEGQKALFIDFYLREKARNIKQTDPQFNDDMREDPYLNALRAVYGYAITCHKAQGGEWMNVYLDIPRNLSLNPQREAFQWLYTAMTRASETLYLVHDFYIK